MERSSIIQRRDLGVTVNANLPRAVVLVEGPSDEAALTTLASRRHLDLAALGVAIVPMGGAHALSRFLDRFGPHGANIPVRGLYDAHEEPVVRHALAGAGLGSRLTRAELERQGFYACDADLEDELIRALGTQAVEAIIAAQGELGPFRTFQRQPAQRTRALEQQLQRFLGTHAGRKIQYARLLVEALDLANVPRPLDRVLVSVW